MRGWIFIYTYMCECVDYDHIDHDKCRRKEHRSS